MRVPIFLLRLSSACTFSVLAHTLRPSDPEAQAKQHADCATTTPQNANHIFNAIHSSMRQWGSSLNHNGMSFFMATVPAGTQLYHGTGSAETVKGMQWLAFEPEHALIFARPKGPPGARPPRDGDVLEAASEKFEASNEHHQKESTPLGPHYPQGPPKCHDRPERHNGFPPTLKPIDGLPRYHEPPRHDRPLPPHRGHYGPSNQGSPHPPFDHPEQSPPPHQYGQTQDPIDISPHEGPHQGSPGYLHTYTPTHALSLLYIDGLSAGKTSNGTLDTQDILLLNVSTSDPSHSPMGDEYFRAQTLCNLSSTLWQDKIDGVLRMEGGFEVILCEFEKHLELRDMMPVNGGQRPPLGDKSRSVMGGWQYMKALTARFHGIGGDRVTIDYEKFVSVFQFADKQMDLWTNDVVSDTPHPRLQNAPPARLREIKDKVTEMILSREQTEGLEQDRNWQRIADMVVNRYSAPLHHLHTDTAIRKDKDAFADYLSILLRPFVASTGRNTTLETTRCVAQFVPMLPVPPLAPATLAHSTIHTVALHLCSTLLIALDTTISSLSQSSTTPPPSHALDLIDSLVFYLSWTTWKDCGPCADEQVCVVPIWPMGSLENHREPKCVGQDGVGHGYWGSPPGPSPSGGQLDKHRHPDGGNRPDGGERESGPQSAGRPGKGGKHPHHEKGDGKPRHRGHHPDQQRGLCSRVLHAVGFLTGWSRPEARSHSSVR